METQNTWIIRDEDRTWGLEQIVQFQLLLLSKIFGKACMYAEPCVIYNDPKEDTPMLIINRPVLTIRLVEKIKRSYCQNIFQLSHELCHYAIRQHKPNKHFTLSWFEEIVCESVSLYALKLSAEHWSECAISKFDPAYSLSIQKYLTAELEKVGTNQFSLCNSIDKLARYEAGGLYNYRDTHRNERNALYWAILEEPEMIPIFCEYMNYLNADNTSINFRNWHMDTPCTLLKVWQKLYPIKEV